MSFQSQTTCLFCLAAFWCHGKALTHLFPLWAKGKHPQQAVGNLGLVSTSTQGLALVEALEIGCSTHWLNQVWAQEIQPFFLSFPLFMLLLLLFGFGFFFFFSTECVVFCRWEASFHIGSCLHPQDRLGNRLTAGFFIPGSLFWKAGRLVPTTEPW